MTGLLNGADFRAAARRRLPRGLFEYIDRGSEDESALAAIADALGALRFRSRVLTGVAVPDLSTELFGQRLAAPMIVAPTALAGLVAHDGEIKLARAAARAGIPFTVATQSISTVEEIRAGAPTANLWFQLYLWQDRALSRRLLDRARAAGVTTLVVTADTAVAPIREYNVRNGFGMPFRWSARAVLDVARHPNWVRRVILPAWLRGGMPAYGHYPPEFRPTITRTVTEEAVNLATVLTWDDLRELRRSWPGELVVKGILDPADARLAADEGMDGIVVSSHGGRNLDTAVAPIDVLPAIAEAVGDRLVVLADSGVRRGSDVLRYVASGARAVLLGRLPLWGLAAADEDGADRLLHLLRTEATTTLVNLGVARPTDCAERLSAVGRPHST